jgi:putative tryptophan/tyrosine transport system substrate-binding protein
MLNYRVWSIATQRAPRGKSLLNRLVEIGGLIAYGFDLADTYRHGAGHVDQILKGRKPSDIPYFQLNKWELIINLKTVKALGFTVPPSLLASADEVIE